MSKMRKASFRAPKQASASHLIHLIGIDQFREELAKQQKAKAEGILEVITATSIKRSKTADNREQEMMDVAYQMHLDGEINDLVWSQIRAMYVYIGAEKDKSGYLTLDDIIFPDKWEPRQDLAFAKRLLPKFLYYQLQQYKELGQSIDSILDQAAALKNSPTNKSNLTSDQLRRAEELTNWHQIKDSTDKRDFLAFLKTYKGGAYERLAYIKLEELAWSELGDAPTYQKLYNFLQSFPYGRHADEAKILIQQLATEDARKRSYKEYEKKKAAFARAERNKERIKYINDLLKSYSNTLFRSSKKSDSRELVETQPATKQKKDKTRPLALIKSLAAGILISLIGVGFLTAPLLSNKRHNQAIRTFVGHTNALKAAAFLPNGRFALSASADRTLKLWDISSGKVIRTFKGHTDIVSSVSISASGRTALSGSYDGTVKHWDLETGQLLSTFNGHKNSVTSVAISEDGHLAVSGSHDKTIKLWHVASGKLLKTFSGHTDWVTAVSFITDTNAIISSSHDKTLRLWDLGTGKTVRQFIGHEGWVTSLSTSSRNLFALSGSYDKTIRLWNMRTGEEIRTFNNRKTEVVKSVFFSPNDKLAITSSFNKRLVLWDINNGKKLKTFPGHEKAVANSITISPDGQYALSAGEDSTLKLWRLKTLKKQSANLN